MFRIPQPRRLLEDTSGATAVEYGLIAAIMVVASIVAFQGVANENTRTWLKVASEVMSASGENASGNQN